MRFDVRKVLAVHARCALVGAARLHKAGFKVIPVTAGSSGWWDLIAHRWPVDAVVGENGGLYFCRGQKRSSVICRYWSSDTERQEDCSRLRTVAEQILQRVTGGRGFELSVPP